MNAELVDTVVMVGSGETYTRCRLEQSLVLHCGSPDVLVLKVLRLYILTQGLPGDGWTLSLWLGSHGLSEYR